MGRDFDETNKRDETAFMSASHKGYLGVVKYLVSKGANIKDSTSLVRASYKGHLEVVKYLVSKGADINAKTKNGKTALDLATESKEKAVVKYLKSITN